MKVTQEKAFAPITITLETLEEAVVLATLVANVVGPSSGPRGITDRLHQAMHNLKIANAELDMAINFPQTTSELLAIATL